MKPDIEKLLERYYAGESTLEEEKQLRTFFQSASVPAHLKKHAGLFRHFSQARQEEPSVKFAPPRSDRPAENRPTGRIRRLTTWGLRLAASVALLAGGFAGGLWYEREQKPGAAVETSSALAIKKTLDFDRMSQTSASERIQAVNESSELPEANQDITQLLINTLNFDDNVNVRLAACQALMRLPDEPGVREALIQSLKIQTDPYVQIMLIEALVSIQEKRAVNEMQRLARDRDLLEAVRQKAEEGMNRLNQSARPSAS
ncbi:HEAT repeat domain-containing protein [Larkinella insperata]|uniref:HEAT repeat domain-containing protein n=1 Tax=Larkinella insperata TaxID=332158 RepID=A0ABW3QNX3_9BACT|nr:HEAT repeat domain-containing protein [Larkinella insperata]